MYESGFQKIILIGTIIYLVMVIIYNGLFIYSNFDNIELLPSNEFGDFLAGIFAPLAFLFLYLGYRQNSISLNLQAKELKASTKALEEQVKEMRAAIKLQEEEIHAKHFYAKPMLNFRYNDFTIIHDDGISLDKDGEPQFIRDPCEIIYVHLAVQNEGGEALQFELIDLEKDLFLSRKHSFPAKNIIEFKFSLSSDKSLDFLNDHSLICNFIVRYRNKYGRKYSYYLELKLQKSNSNSSVSQNFNFKKLTQNTNHN